MDKIFWGCDDFFSIFCATKQLKKIIKEDEKFLKINFVIFKSKLKLSLKTEDNHVLRKHHNVK